MVAIASNKQSVFDLAIIGAGIIGACAAWYARKLHPEWSIAVFDRSLAGSGTSHYSASLDFAYGHTPVRKRLSERSRNLYRELRNDIPGLPIKDLPFFGFIEETKASTLLDCFCDEQARISPDVIPYLKQHKPDLRLSDNTTAILGTTASYAVKNEVATILIQKFAGTPASYLFEATEINFIIPVNDLLQLNTETNSVFYSKRIIQATGPWMNQGIGKEYSATQKIAIKKVVAFHIYHPPTPDDPVLYFFDDEAFLMPRYEEGYWLFSYKCNHWHVMPDTSTLKINQNDRQEAMAILEKYMPRFVNFCRGGRVFCDAYSVDSNPIIELAGSYGNYAIAGAAGGSGFRLAPAIAEQAINLFTGKC